MKLCLSPEPVITPNPGGQEQFANDWEHFIVSAEGGWYSGKTFIGAAKEVTGHLHNAFDENDEPTFIPSLCVAPTYSNAMDFCVPHLQDRITETGLSYHWVGGGSLSGGRYSGPALIIPELGTKRNPSVILIRSADVPKRIAGFTVGIAWGDEPARWKTDRFNPLNDPFIQLTGRVRQPDVKTGKKARLLQILLTYTNEGDATRVYEEMHSGKTDRALYRIPTRENPAARDFEQRQKGVLTPELAEQYLGGKAASFSGGKVYGSFDYALHVNANVKLRRGIPLHISLDFNIVPGMHLEVGQYHHDLDLFTTVHEIHGPRMDVGQAMDVLVAYLKEIKWNFDESGPLEVFGDATGKSEWAGTGQSCYHIVQVHLKSQQIPYRLRVPRANPQVVDRVNAVNCALMDVEKKIHWHIHTSCERLTEDLRKLIRDKYGDISLEDRKLSHASSAEGYRIWFIRPIRVPDTGIGGRIITG